MSSPEREIMSCVASSGPAGSAGGIESKISSPSIKYPKKKRHNFHKKTHLFLKSSQILIKIHLIA